MRLPRAAGLLSIVALVGLCAAAFWRCGSAGCLVAGTDRLDQLVLQLEGGCCGFHSQPTDEQIDNSCKPIASPGYSLFFGDYQCAAWAADCLAELGEHARPAVPALIQALLEGPNNYDTGDGVIPTRSKIARALGATGDPRAVDALLQALANPKPVDVGPGAIGYASKEPAGQADFLAALGALGPVAKPAVDAILAHFVAPIQDRRDERIVRSAAIALGQIGDPKVLPTLIAALDDPARAPFGARALAAFGSAARDAAPTLTRLIEAAPDGEDNQAFRRAIFEILGKAAFQALPKNYDGMLTELMRVIQSAAKRQGLRPASVHIDGPNHQVVQSLASGEAVGVSFDRDTWIVERAVAGTLRLERDGAVVSRTAHSSLTELERNLEHLLSSLAAR